MRYHFISRRFLRIKALQHLYSGAIHRNVYQIKAIEQIRQDLAFDIFVHDPSIKKSLEAQREQAVKYFLEAIQDGDHHVAIPDSDQNPSIFGALKKNIAYYNHHVLEDIANIHTQFDQIKRYLYRDYLCVLWIFKKYHTIAHAKYHATPANLASQPLLESIATSPVLQALVEKQEWFAPLYQKYDGWPMDNDFMENPWNGFVQSPIPPLDSYHRDDPDNNRIFVQLFKVLILQNKQIDDFLTMQDLYWCEHKHIVKKMIVSTFQSVLQADYGAFDAFLKSFEEELSRARLFHNLLLKTAIDHSKAYRSIISQQAQKWDYSRIISIDKIILQLALAEMLYIKEVPTKVILDEYIEIAKLYGTAKSSQFINGILDGVLTQGKDTNDVQSLDLNVR